jgi:hypothetical protein
MVYSTHGQATGIDVDVTQRLVEGTIHILDGIGLYWKSMMDKGSKTVEYGRLRLGDHRPLLVQ